MECMLCHYWYFKKIGYKLESNVSGKCHDVLMTAYELKNIAILNVKVVDYRCILQGVSKNDAINILHKKRISTHLKQNFLYSEDVNKNPALLFVLSYLNVFLIYQYHYLPKKKIY